MHNDTTAASGTCVHARPGRYYGPDQVRGVACSEIHAGGTQQSRTTTPQQQATPAFTPDPAGTALPTRCVAWRAGILTMEAAADVGSACAYAPL